MKKSYLFVASMIIALLVSAWAPMPMYAHQSFSGLHQTIDLGKTKTKLAKLVVDNRTGGTLYVTLSGTYSYSFAATKQGKTTFTNIQPGKYQITVRTSACAGSLTYSKTIKSSAGLRPFVCRHK